MKQYNAIFISDVHMGTKHAQVDKLLTFLKETECRHLYIVGDLIDGWELKRKWYWDETITCSFRNFFERAGITPISLTSPETMMNLSSSLSGRILEV